MHQPKTDFRCEFELPKYCDLKLVESPPMVDIAQGFINLVIPESTDLWFKVPHDFKQATKQDFDKNHPKLNASVTVVKKRTAKEAGVVIE